MPRRRRGLGPAGALVRGPRRGGHERLDERPPAEAAAHAHRDAPHRARLDRGRRPRRRAARPRARPRRPGALRPARRRPRAVLRPQPADGLRPRRLHPLRPLHPLHAGRDAVLGAHLRGPRPRGARRPDPRPLVARHRVRALRRLPLRLPDGRDLREEEHRHDGPRHRAHQDEDDLHLLRRRLPARPQRRPGQRQGREDHLRAGVPAERGRALREGALLLRLHPPPGPPHRAARSAARTASSTRRPGRRRSQPPPPG